MCVLICYSFLLVSGNLADGIVGIYSCHGTGGNQEWSFTKSGHIKHTDLCLVLDGYSSGAKLKLKICNNSTNQVNKSNNSKY